MLRNKAERIELLAGMATTWLAWRADRRGVTAVEYVIIAGVLAVVIVVSVTAIGPALSNIFNKVATPL